MSGSKLRSHRADGALQDDRVRDGPEEGEWAKAENDGCAPVAAAVGLVLALVVSALVVVAFMFAPELWGWLQTLEWVETGSVPGSPGTSS